MNITLKQLRYLVAVADHASITAAAQALFVSQPAVSSAVAQIEQNIGAQLLLRYQAKGVALTTVGRHVAADARRLLTHADEFAASAQQLGGSLTGPLTIGCFVTLSPFYLPSLLRAFVDSHPGIETVILEGTLSTLQTGLLDGECEIALMYGLELSDQIAFEPLIDIPPYVLLPRSHRLARQPTIELRALAADPMILLDLPHSREYFRSLFQAVGVDPVIRHRTQSFELVRGLVANGHGYSVLNLKPADDLTYEGTRLVSVNIADPVRALSIGLAWIRDARLGRRAEAFAQQCRLAFL
ncbi:MAG: LysR substrate-binding domain-containing protein [Gammaproteobacteria bacterium]|nr:LysR substrate-binding domain-containing protein [Gammaproteobacteria bacterium]MDH3466557.1 LysR substrate-binding domain-containing protein [Gammaproteobacteria bacterium]